MNKKERINTILEKLVINYPLLDECRDSLVEAVQLSIASYEGGGKLLICGNGGSASDSAHIVGELMKGFMLSRRLPAEFQARLKEVDSDYGEELANGLQQALPAISLCEHTSLISAVANDNNPQMIFAQQVVGYGRLGDIFLGISTSGNSRNVVRAAAVAKAQGLMVIGLTGRGGGALRRFCDTCIQVPSTSVPAVQELHLPVYHAYCAMLESWFFG